MLKNYRNIYKLALISTAWLLMAAATAQDYRILVSNDDGIESPQLAALVTALRELPDVEVTISAPRENQSGSSQASTGTPFVVEEFQRDGEFYGYAVHARPADAVRWAVKTLGNVDPFDLVVTGINQGANVGDVSHLSGTVGAAMEAQYHGIPSIAVSQEGSDVDTAASARFAANLVRQLRERGEPRGVVISVNIPGGEIQGVRVRPMGESYLLTSEYEVVERNNDGTVYQRIRVRQPATDPRNDTWAYQQGFITVTPLKFDWTDYEYLSDLQSWNWDTGR